MDEKLAEMKRILTGNLNEARKYALEAAARKESDRQTAEWMLVMAQKHLEFNAAGLLIADKEAERLAQAENCEGVRKMWKMDRAIWAEESAQVNALIMGFGK